MSRNLRIGAIIFILFWISLYAVAYIGAMSEFDSYVESGRYACYQACQDNGFWSSSGTIKNNTNNCACINATGTKIPYVNLSSFSSTP